jgi:dipeptidase E
MPALLMSKNSEETKIEKAFFQFCRRGPSSLAYIPAKTDSSRNYFKAISQHYESLGVEKIFYCDLDAEYKPSVIEKISSCDAVYLAGGLTPYFLQTLQKRKVLELIKSFANEKMVIGISAGAIILGQDITILSDDPGEGYFTQALPESAAVGFTAFDFWPHYGRHKSDEDRFIQRSLKRCRTVIGCDDHSGLIVKDDKVRVIGSATLFEGGKMVLLADGACLELRHR